MGYFVTDRHRVLLKRVLTLLPPYSGLQLSQQWLYISTTSCTSWFSKICQNTWSIVLRTLMASCYSVISMKFHEWEQVCYPKAEHSTQRGPGSMFRASSLPPVQGWGLLITHTVNTRHIKYKTKFYIKEVTIPHLPCRRAWQPTLVLLPEESHGWSSLGQATVHRVVKSRAWLKCLSTLAHTPFWSFPGDSVVENLPAM